MHYCLQKVTVVLVVLAVACGNDRDGPTAPHPPPTPAVIGPTSFTVVEGETAVGTLRATDPDTPPADLMWSMAGGADRGHFTLGAGGVLAFAGAKDYEAPDDAGGDGTYELTVRVSDGTDDATATVRVSLSNRNEAPAADAGADQPDVEEGATVTLKGDRRGPRRGRRPAICVDPDGRCGGDAVGAIIGGNDVRGADRTRRRRGAAVHPADDRHGRPLGRGRSGSHRRRRWRRRRWGWRRWWRRRRRCADGSGGDRSDVVHGG